jgi:hypothetical protein
MVSSDQFKSEIVLHFFAGSFSQIGVKPYSRQNLVGSFGSFYYKGILVAFKVINLMLFPVSNLSFEKPNSLIRIGA